MSPRDTSGTRFRTCPFKARLHEPTKLFPAAGLGYGRRGVDEWEVAGKAQRRSIAAPCPLVGAPAGTCSNGVADDVCVSIEKVAAVLNSPASEPVADERSDAPMTGVEVA